MPKNRTLSASMEDYLEAIFHIVSEKQAARAKDIAKRLKVNNSSVTGALRSLAEKGFINYAPYDVITLTPEGNKLAEDIVRKHEALRDFFVKVLFIDPAEAEKAACEMEHAVSRVILDRLIRFTEFVEFCPKSGDRWIGEFWNRCERDCEHNKPYENCENCINRSLKDFRKKRDRMEGGAKDIRLETMSPGQKGKILKIQSRSGISRRMADMEVRPGNIIKVEGVSPTGDIDIKVKGYHMTLRHDEASKITVELYG